ncbi:MAG: YdcF family protein [Acidimicrobiales bacterium]
MKGWPRSPRRTRRRVLRVLLRALVVLVVLVVAVSARLFVWSPIDKPARADAVVALGGDPGQHRAKKALSLAEAGYAPTAVVSLGGYPPAPCPHARRPVRIVCFRADPLDTRGEAEFVGRLAARRGWNRLIVVPERSQATRARLLFERCTSARLLMVPVSDPPSHLLFDVAYEWGALAKALIVHRSC